MNDTLQLVGLNRRPSTASTASSATLDHDPSFYGVVETSDPKPNGAQIVDLTEEDSGFNEGDFLSDEYLDRLFPSWSSSIPVEPAQVKKFVDSCLDNNGIIYKVGQTVEVFSDTFTYLRIEHLYEAGDEGFFMRGRPLAKTKAIKGEFIPKRSREIVWLVDEDAPDVPLALVKSFVNVHFTNNTNIEDDLTRHAHQNHLFCRLKLTKESKYKCAIEYLTMNEADKGYKIDPHFLRQVWRGETRPFGSKDVAFHDLTSDGETDDKRETRAYTFGDAFCGAGGVSCGARKAGLKAKWAFDKCAKAAASYKINFPRIECLKVKTIHSFLKTDDAALLKVDVVHGSPPCQTFSGAHTREGRNDDENSACIFGCENLMEKCKPRVLTMEETDGLLSRHQETFHCVIHGFLATGYSVRWAVLYSKYYGVPQLRKRLIIIASGPGEKLPPFPLPTHGEEVHLKPLVTINQAIRNIPARTPDHDIHRAGFQPPRRPYDGNTLAKTITCNGGENYHPSGRRPFTNREFACLQTFPLTYRFSPVSNTDIRRQIGNAVPPAMAAAIYREVVRSLRETDAELGRREEEGDDIVEVEMGVDQL